VTQTNSNAAVSASNGYLSFQTFLSAFLFKVTYIR